MIVRGLVIVGWSLLLGVSYCLCLVWLHSCLAMPGLSVAIHTYTYIHLHTLTCQAASARFVAELMISCSQAAVPMPAGKVGAARQGYPSTSSLCRIFQHPEKALHVRPPCLHWQHQQPCGNLHSCLVLMQHTGLVLFMWTSDHES